MQGALGSRPFFWRFPVAGSCAGNNCNTMATGDETKLPLSSRDVHAERLAQFRELFPEASTEGKLDLKKLAQLLGDAATDAPERYGLSWAGKSEAIRAIQITSPGTLLTYFTESWPPLPFTAKPDGLTAENAKNAEEPTGGEPASGSLSSLRSLRFNPSGNLIIEGDNLKVLKSRTSPRSASAASSKNYLTQRRKGAKKKLRN